MTRPGRHFAVVSYRDIRHPEFGGAEVILYEIFRRFVRWGHRVSFVTGSWPGAPREEEIEGLRIRRAGSQYDFNFRAPALLRRVMRESPVDLVVEDINKIPFFTPLFQRRAPVLGIVPHLFGTTVFRQAALPLALYVYFYEQFIPLVYRRSRFSVLSQTTLEDLVRRGIPRERMRVIRAGIDHDYYRPPDRGEEPPGPVITYLGRIKKYKRIDLVLRALPAILARVPGAEYWIVGEGDYRPRLEALAEALGVGRRVRFLGYQEGAAKLETLYRTRVLVYTSPKEGWGLSVIEGNALGIPCVASRSPGLSESVRDGETGLLVPHGEVGPLAEALVRLLSDDGLWLRMGRAGRAWAARYDWESSARETLELAEEIIARGRA
ncbi:MAG: glycosyltransferase family 4 protein [Candidatus Eisenbacteria bacterium]|uniref:Glycosyltransferase family 4 protein n=1 Tax=Eiseniibacteriota bacterium TaxID=2212470 RepID=A0A938BQ49_UNCEI|nr:glycosyltransferase family 4 protein [Candidatus Eisenbacteria bacterium]